MRRVFSTCLLVVIFLASCHHDKIVHPSIVFQTDFGVKDGAVSAMKGVAKGVDPSLQLYDLTHEIPAYDIWEASYRLFQTVGYWPGGTVFVSVVDPGVGTSRRSVVALLNNGQYIVGPDNGMLTLVSESPGISQIRLIDETLNRRSGSGESYTFHGRDVYAYTAARLASGVISFDQVGRLDSMPPVLIPYVRAGLSADGKTITGNIPALDIAYGNVWSNISDSLFSRLGVKMGDSVSVEIRLRDSVVYHSRMPYVPTFGGVAQGQPLLYLNSLMNVSVALNEDDFAKKFGIGKGGSWTISLSR